MTGDDKNMSEAKLTDLAMLSNKHCFRNDCGQGYQGGVKKVAKTSGPIHVEKGDIVVINPVPVKYGLQVGSGDLVGYTEVKLTPEMVDKLKGKTVAIFTSVEVKTLRDKPSRDQIIWYLNVRLSGGIAKMLHCNKDLTIEEILAMPRRTDKNKEAKDKIIDDLYQEFNRRRGVK